tara:strand:+ start:152 stop:1027 length:876 start_codon:yes stop_codon:yes gene_type:complete
MKKYIGPKSMQNFKSKVLSILNISSNIFVLLLFLFPIIYFLFHSDIIFSRTLPKAPITEDRKAVCAILRNDGSSDYDKPMCTAFLVTENLLLTARHCVVDEYDQPREILLDFDLIEKEGYNEIPAEILYLPEFPEDDYAILKVNIDLGIQPLEMISSDEVEEPKLYNPEVKFIGYPVSLDVNFNEIAEKGKKAINTYTGAQEQKTCEVVAYQLPADLTEFKLSCQVFGGNSGGPVIDTEKNKVIGIVAWRDPFVETDTRGQSYCEKVAQILSDPRIDQGIWTTKDLEENIK